MTASRKTRVSKELKEQMLLEDPQIHTGLIAAGKSLVPRALTKVLNDALDPERLPRVKELLPICKEYQEKVNQTTAQMERLDVSADRKAVEDLRALQQSCKDKHKELSYEIYQELVKAEVRAIVAMDKFRETLVGQSTVTRQEAEKMAAKVKIDENVHDKKALVSTLADFFEMTGGKGSKSLKRLLYDKDRAYAFGIVINVGSDRDPETQRRTLWHELGHHVEFENQDIATANKHWIVSRAHGLPRPLNELAGQEVYEDDEVAYPDRFIDPYVGKVYRNGSTEVLSMGIQFFTSAEDMVLLYKRDREHFHLTVGAITKK